MVEYGNGVGTATGATGGGTGGSMDVGAAAGRFVNDASHTISTLPPEALIAIVIAIFLGLVILRRAF
jgi:hypothetical protein